jgi:ArsR family transcriptional regulator
VRRSRNTAADCASRLRVFAEPTRLSVLELLRDGPKRVAELNAVLRIDPTLLSHHLKVLFRGGMVRTTRDGKSIVYALEPSVLLEGGNKIDLGCCVVSFR